jgi:VCBS repeat-containing protein
LVNTPDVIENIVEPTVVNLTKTVTSFDPNPGSPTDTGSATISIDFKNSGDGVGYDFHLIDSVNGGSNYVVTAVIIDGTSYAPGSLPAGVTISNTVGGISADFDRLAQNSTVRVVYTVDVANNVTIATSDATLKWTSLPVNFAGFSGSTVGVAASPDGERDGSGGTTRPNTYIRSEGAGLGIISGKLWDDTTTPNGLIDPGEVGLANQTVTLTWAGIDGNLATGGDNLVYTTVTASDGTYHFGVLPAGNFRIDVPNPVIAYPFVGNTENAKVRVDSDSASPLGQIVVVVGESASKIANAGYVRPNDAPVNTVPGPQTIYEDNQPISGDPPGPPVAITGISFADVDAANGTLQVTLAVGHGILNLTDLNGSAITSGALDSITVTLSGSLTQLNAALATLTYMPDADYNGTDKLTVTTNDRGNTGDYDGNLTPNQPSDARTDIDEIVINITPVNDAPIAKPDAATAVEAGGTFNGTGGTNPLGNLIANDIDVDIGTNGDILSVQTVSSVNGANIDIDIAPGLVPTTIAGNYGTLLVISKGAFQYVVDNDNADVQALRLSGQTLTEKFNYTIADLEGATSSSTLTVTIKGANDTPVGENDEGTVYEAGGVNNGSSGGSDDFPNVLTNDSDVDSVTNGESRSVTGIRNLREIIPGALTVVSAGTTSANGTTVSGTYGTLTIGANGSYVYTLDNTLTAVERLVPGDTLLDYFTYQVTDALGLNDLAQITITINGADDNPVASDDLAEAQPLRIDGGTIVGDRVVGGTEVGSETNPSGNVILNASRPGNITDPGGNGIDFDVDRTDQPNTVLTVSAIRTGTELGSGTAGTLGVALAGKYGTLTINADGSFVYDVDSRNAAVWGLGAGDTLTDEYFTYELSDTTSPTPRTDKAQLNIIIKGVNDPPLVQDDAATAIEAGGLNNAIAGSDPGGNVLDNDSDPDGDALRVSAIRTGDLTTPGTSGTPGTPLRGLYGDLTVNADGTWNYVLDNALAAVEALRISGQTLTDTFTYTATDILNASTNALLTITIDGRNDTPIAHDDTGAAIEAGGFFNTTPGSPATGDVLTNDTDVDSVANGETQTVIVVTGISTGAVNGQTAGNFGSLILNADGSFTYTVDDANPAVEALRLSTDTLTDSFSYTMRDTAGATSTATLTVTIHGANDNPVARDDVGLATDVAGPPVTTGNVLPNDSDVDGGDSKTVVAIRTGPENGSGSAGSVGTRLQGKYGSLVLNADGSWRYEVDTTNSEVLGAAGAGKVLSDVFTYTMRDTAGATDQAQLTITLDMIAPYTDFPVSPFLDRDPPPGQRGTHLPELEPIVFVGPVVNEIQREVLLSNARNDGTDIQAMRQPEIQSLSLAAGLGTDPALFVTHAVQDVRLISEFDRLQVEGRQGVVSLSADGLLADPSLFVTDPRWMMIESPAAPRAGVTLRTASAPSFREQLQQAAQRFKPVAVNSSITRLSGETIHSS